MVYYNVDVSGNMVHYNLDVSGNMAYYDLDVGGNVVEFGMLNHHLLGFLIILNWSYYRFLTLQ